jgi:flagella basal body P-ring formation protein FlgA
LRGEVLASSDDPERYAIKRSLPGGSPLSRWDLKPLGGIEAGDRISIRFQRGTVRLEMPGRAMGSGDVGDTIPVRALDPARQFRGVVVDAKMVEVPIP